jgi:hypothetical protein
MPLLPKLDLPQVGPLFRLLHLRRPPRGRTPRSQSARRNRGVQKFARGKAYCVSGGFARNRVSRSTISVSHRPQLATPTR